MNNGMRLEAADGRTLAFPSSKQTPIYRNTDGRKLLPLSSSNSWTLFAALQKTLLRFAASSDIRPPTSSTLPSEPNLRRIERSCHSAQISTRTARYISAFTEEPSHQKPGLRAAQDLKRSKQRHLLYGTPLAKTLLRKFPHRTILLR